MYIYTHIHTSIACVRIRVGRARASRLGLHGHWVAAQVKWTKALPTLHSFSISSHNIQKHTHTHTHQWWDDDDDLRQSHTHTYMYTSYNSYASSLEVHTLNTVVGVAVEKEWSLSGVGVDR